MNPKVDAFLARQKSWQAEFTALRALALECDMTEELKWGTPCYTHQGSNVVLIHGFKQYCALLFFKGALLKDSKGLLIQQTANVQSARQLRFTSLDEIEKKAATIRAYIKEAKKIEQAGLKVEFKKTAEFEMPDEFAAKLKEDKLLKSAFEKLTPGRQRAYLLHFSSAKLPKTRQARVAKAIPLIMSGKGLDD